MDIYAQLLAGEPHATAERKRELLLEAARLLGLLIVATHHARWRAREVFRKPLPAY